MNKRLFAGILSVLVFQSTTGRSATIYVPDDYVTIQGAVYAAVPYMDEIEVAPGTYNEVINFNGKAIRLFSTGGPELTTIEAYGAAVVWCITGEGSDTVLEGFTITGGTGMRIISSSPTITNCMFIGTGIDTKWGGIFNYLYSNPTITNCLFIGNTADGGGGIGNFNFSNPTITNCMFLGNIADYGGGISNSSSSPKITNCMFIGNTADGGGAISCDSGSAPTITNCTFSKNTAYIGAIYMWANDNSSPTITNCILWGDFSAEIVGSATVTYSNVQGGWQGEGNIELDPLFVNPSLNDFHLLADSPCIDAGDPTDDYTGQIDIDGESRVMNGRVDIGADECSEPPCPPPPPHEPLLFVQISDTHIASEESRRNLCVLLCKVINEVQPSFIVNTGDIVDYGCGRAFSGGEYCKFDLYKSYSQIMKLATDAGIPVHNIPGNHDQRTAWPHQTVCDTFPSCFEDPGNTDNEFHLGRSTFSYNDILFPVLDTGNGNCSGTLTDDDINFLKDLNPCIPKVILTHHPAVADPDDGGWLSDEFCPLWGGVGILDGREDFIKYCENPANNVYMVLSGHTHHNQVYPIDWSDGPRYVQTGSTLDGVARRISFASSGPPEIQPIQLTEEDYNYESCELHSPGNLHAYDSDGRHTGYEPSSGSERGIPQSVYFSHYVFETEEGPVVSPEEVLILDPTDDYLWEVVGTEEGTYGLDITSVTGGVETAFGAVDIPTAPGAKHVYAVNWAALSAGEDDAVVLGIDADGDSVFEKIVIADEDLTSDEFTLQTESVIDFEPDTLNLRSPGKVVTAYIELPEGFDVSDIDVSTLKLNETVSALLKPVKVGDHDEDGIADLMVKFDRQQVAAVLEAGEQIVYLSGRLDDGTLFAGMDTIRVLGSKGSEIAESEFDSTMHEEVIASMEENLQITEVDSVDTGGEVAFDVEEAVTFMLFEADEIIGELGPESFNNKESAFELACAIDDVFNMLDEGMYFEVMVMLEGDILERMDGCANPTFTVNSVKLSF